MPAIVQPAASGGGAVEPARNDRGSVTGLAPASTHTLVSVVAGTRKLRGFSVHGDTDAVAWVEVDGSPLAGMSARFNRVLPAYIALPNPEAYPASTSTVTLRVRNDGDTAGDFEGTLFGE